MQVLCSKTNEQLMTLSQDELLVRAFRLGVKDVILSIFRRIPLPQGT